MEAVRESAQCTVPPVPNNKTGQWFKVGDEEFQGWLAQRKSALTLWESDRKNAEYKKDLARCDAEIQRRSRQMAEQHWTAMAEKMEKGAKNNDWAAVYRAIRENKKRRTPTAKKAPQMKRPDGALTENSAEYMSSWKEHFTQLLNNVSAQPNLEEMERDGFLPEAFPHPNSVLDENFTEMDTHRAIEDLKADTVGGLDGLCPELFRSSKSKSLVSVITNLANKCLNEGEVPSQFKDVIITILHKAGDKYDHNNYRGISLINVVGKILERMVANRIGNYCESTPRIYGETFFGFRTKTGTRDAIFVSKFITAEVLARGEPLYQCYVDLVKAYDNVNRDLLFKILELRGLPPKIIAVIKGLLCGSRAFIRIEGQLSEPFLLLCGLKQGSVLSPLLFRISMDLLTCFLVPYDS